MRSLPKFLLAILLLTGASASWGACPEGTYNNYKGECVPASSSSSTLTTVNVKTGGYTQAAEEAKAGKTGGYTQAAEPEPEAEAEAEPEPEAEEPAGYVAPSVGWCSYPCN